MDNKGYNKETSRIGDKGKTSLIGGTKVSKFHIRLEAYGTVDELSAFIGLLCDHEIPLYHKKNLKNIQHRLFMAMSLLACEDKTQCDKLPKITEDDISFLEQEIISMNEALPKLKSFIIPGGHPAISSCHVVRTICRRCERIIFKMAEQYYIEEEVLKLFNRLSDYFFVLARKLGQELNVDESYWKPKD